MEIEQKKLAKLYSLDCDFDSKSNIKPIKGRERVVFVFRPVFRPLLSLKRTLVIMAELIAFDSEWLE